MFEFDVDANSNTKAGCVGTSCSFCVYIFFKCELLNIFGTVFIECIELVSVHNSYPSKIYK